MIDQPQGCPRIEAITPDFGLNLCGHRPQKNDRSYKVSDGRNQPRFGCANGEPLGQNDILREPTQSGGRSGGVALANRWSNLPLGVRLVALLCLFLAPIAALEVWARGQKPQLPGWGGPQGASGLMEAHDTRLWGMPPGVKANAEGSTASINELGLRGSIPERPRPSGRNRIMSLGDSAFFGFGVNDHQVFTYELSSILRKQGVDVDDVNAGVSGYSIAQHKILLEEVGWDLEPTLLILCNVWSDNTWDTFHDEDLIASRNFASKNPLTQSALVKLAAARWAALNPGEGGRVIVWNSAGEWPVGKKRRVPLDRWIKLTDGIMREAADRGIGILMLKPTNSFLLEGLAHGPDPGWQPYFDAMDGLAKHHDVPLLDVTEVYQAAMTAGTPLQDILWDKMHPSELGHRILAEGIAEKLSQVGWPENRLLAKYEAFSGEGYQDLPQPNWTDDAGDGSPQRNLFALTEEHEAQIIKSVEAGPGPPGGVAGTGGGPVGVVGVPPTSPMGDNPVSGRRTSWGVRIDIEGGEPPYRVQLLDADGRTVGSARVGKAASIRLNVRGEVETVSVQVRDSQNRSTQVKASPSDPNVSLTLGE